MSSNSSAKISSCGRIQYVEPNSFDIADAYNTRGRKKSNTDINHDYENYCIGVDLLVDTRSRYSFQGEDDRIGRRLAHFIGGHYDQDGTTWFLTTDYSNYSERNLLKGDNTESIGIQDIKINFESWGVPVVDITFVDVRGASLMLPEEAGLYTQLMSDKKHGYSGLASDVKSGSFFRSLLSFPPPVFYLRVKGFYGDGVTFKLAVSQVKMSFDSKNGNFRINCRFIGYKYGILTDIPFSLCYIAPKTDTGSRIWDRCTSNSGEGGIRYHLYGSNTASVSPLIDVLINDISDIVQNGLQSFYSNEDVRELQRLEDRKKLLSDVISTFPFKTWSYYCDDDKKYYVNHFFAKDVNKFVDFQKRIGRLIGETDINIDAYKAEYPSDGLLDELKDFIVECKDNVDNDGRYAVDSIINVSIVDNTQIFNGNRALFNVYYDFNVDFKQKCNILKDGDVIYLFSSPDVNSDFIHKLSSEINKIDKKINEQTKKVDEVELEVISSALGFTPSIKNMFQILFCHFETFMRMFFEYLSSIWAECKDGNRNADDYLRSPNDSDMNTVDFAQMPPFPLFTKQVMTKNGVKREMMWPPDYDRRLSNMKEVEFVYELLRAANLNGINGDIEAEENDYSNDDFGGGSLSSNDIIFYPTTNYDLMRLMGDYADVKYNPYEFVKFVQRGEILNWLFSTFMCRDVYYEQSNNIKEENINTYAKYFGAVEATNAFNALNKKYDFDELFKDDTRYDLCKAYKFDVSSSDNFTENDSYKWLCDNDGNIFLPIGAYNEEHIRRFSQTSKRSEISEYFLMYDWNKNSYNSYYISEDVPNFNFGTVTSTERIGIPSEKIIPIQKCDVEHLLYTKDSFVHGYEMFKTIDDVRRLDLNSEGVRIGENILVGENFSIAFSNSDGENGRKCPVFLTSLYYKQQGNDSILARAYLILMSIASTGNNGFMDGKNVNGYRLYCDVLCEGAYYWRIKEYEEKGVDPIKYDENQLCDCYKIPRDCFDDNKGTGERRYGLSLDGKYITVSKDFINSGRREKCLDLFLNSVNLFSELNYRVSIRKIDNRGKVVDVECSDFENEEILKEYLPYKVINFYRCDTISTSKHNGVYYLTGVAFDSDDYTLNVDLINFLSSTLFCVDPSISINGKKIENSKLNGEFRKIAWKEFSDKLTVLYNEKKERSNGSDNNTDRTSESQGDDDYVTKSNDVRLSTYLTLKNLYEKWVCNTRLEDWIISNQDDNTSQYKFLYLDSYYRDIGDKLTVNLEMIHMFIDLYTKGKEGSINTRSLYSLLGEIVSKSQCMLLPLPFMFGQQRNSLSLANLFDAKRIGGVSFDDTSTIVVMYPYKASSALDTDGVGGEFKNDGFDLADSLGNISPVVPVELSSIDEGDDNVNMIPAFGVTYARQGQGYFTDISLDTSSPTQSEYTIQSTINIAGGASKYQVSSGIYGQDLYRVFSNYAYICKVSMLGNAMISPLMYFQLNNVPMWKGAYIITSVNHSITPGDMKTSFSGYRISKYANKIVESTPICSSLRSNNKTSTNVNINGNVRVSNHGAYAHYANGAGAGVISNSVINEGIISNLFETMSNVFITRGDRALNTGEYEGYCALYSYLICLSLDSGKVPEDLVTKGGMLTNSYHIGYDACYRLYPGTKKVINSGRGPSYYCWEICRRTGRDIIEYLTGLTASDVSEHIKDYKYNDGDLVVYWYSPTNNFDFNKIKVIDRGNSRHYPGHAQVYHSHSKYDGNGSSKCYNWVSSKKENYGAHFVYSSYLNYQDAGWTYALIRRVR